MCEIEASMDRHKAQLRKEGKSDEPKTINAVECGKCERLMRKDSREYFKITGGILVGDNGGIIGSNNPEQSSILCKECFQSIIVEYLPNPSRAVKKMREERQPSSSIHDLNY